MIKIIHARHLQGSIIRVQFSDGKEGDYDLSPILERDTILTAPLREPSYFARFFLELGALCWPNGLELSPGSIHARLESAGALRTAARVA